jgi:hypothetical protein
MAAWPHVKGLNASRGMAVARLYAWASVVHNPSLFARLAVANPSDPGLQAYETASKRSEDGTILNHFLAVGACFRLAI